MPRLISDRLTNPEIWEIYRLYKIPTGQRFTQHEIADRFNTSLRTVSQICTGKRHVDFINTQLSQLNLKQIT